MLKIRSTPAERPCCCLFLAFFMVTAETIGVFMECFQTMGTSTVSCERLSWLGRITETTNLCRIDRHDPDLSGADFRDTPIVCFVEGWWRRACYRGKEDDNTLGGALADARVRIRHN